MKSIESCQYCNSTHDLHRDHVIPKSYSNTTSFKNTEYNPIVWACASCNTLLNNAAVHTIDERKDYLYGKLKQKFKKLLATPDWTAEELRELSPQLATKIKIKEREKQHIKQRLFYLMEQ
jgi:hypothetical protein